MAVARITLIGCAAYVSRYGQYSKGQTKVCTDLEEIKYYLGMEAFQVELLTPLEEPEKFGPAVIPAEIEAEAKKAKEEKVASSQVPSHPDTLKMTEPPKPKEDSLPEIAAPTPKEEKVEKAASTVPEIPPPPVVTERGKKRRKTGN